MVMIMSEKDIHGNCDYRPEFCERLIKYAEEGLFLEEIANKFEVDYVSMWRWTKMFPPFCKAYTRAKTIIIGNLKRDLMNKNGEKFYNSKVNEFLINQMTRQMQYAPVGVKGIASGSTEERIKAILTAAENEEIRSDEVKNLVDTLKTVFELENASKALTMLEKIEEKN